MTRKQLAALAFCAICALAPLNAARAGEEEKSPAPPAKEGEKVPAPPAPPAGAEGPKAQATKGGDWTKRIEAGRRELDNSHPWEAEKILGQCFKEAKAFAEDDPRKAEAHIAMGDVEIYLGRFERALPLFDEARRLLEARLGKDAVEILPAILGQAECKSKIAAEEIANAAFMEAMALAQRAKGATPDMKAVVSTRLEGFYYHSRQYARAEEMCRRRLQEALDDPAALPWGPLTVRTTLLGLVLLQGRHEEGRKMAAEVVEEGKRLAGAESAEVARICDTVGKAFAQCKDYPRAIEHFRTSTAIWEKNSKAFGAQLGFTLLQLGNALRLGGQAAEAEQVYLRALKLWEGRRAPPRILESLRGLADVYDTVGKPDMAVVMMQRALTLNEKYYGKDLLAVAYTSNRLAQLLANAKRFAEAEPLFRKVIAAREKVMGPWAMDAAMDRFWLAYAIAKQNRQEEALAQYRQAADALLNARTSVLPGQPTHSRQAWNDSQSWCWQDFFSYCLKVQAQLPDSAAIAVDAALRFQGSLLDMGTAEREALFASGDPQLKEQARQIAVLRSRIANGYRSGLATPESIRAFQDDSAAVKALEDKLSRACAPYARQLQLHEGGPAEIRAAMPEGSVLVTVLRLQRSFLEQDGTTRFPHYLAFVLERGGASSMFDLGAAPDIEATLSALTSALADASTRLARDGAPGQETAHRDVVKKLSEQLLAPLYDRLKDKPRWFFCFDGPIATLNVALLPEPGGEALVFERREVSYLTRASEILGFAPAKLAGADVRILADPDFGAKIGGEGDLAQRGSALSGLKWMRLPGTRAEADALAALFQGKNLKVAAFTGAQATREALFAGPAPRFLHLATHGFSLPEKITAGVVGNVRGLSGIVEKEEAEATVAKVANLLVCKHCGNIHAKGLRTGLVLAGASQAGGGGIVLAEELQALDLFGTEMVVLSACETGLGDIEAGEGVQGLRSAFLESGARSLVTSLWKVPDRETKDLMCAFYRHLLEGERKSRALQKAMLEVRTAQQKAKGASHPFYWAGFILVGNPD